MLNRAIQVKLVKKDKKETTAPGQIDVTLEGKVAIVGHYLGEIVEKIGGAVITYVLVDTFRQVLVARAQK
jgi:hypothetical protein